MAWIARSSFAEPPGFTNRQALVTHVFQHRSNATLVNFRGGFPTLVNRQYLFVVTLKKPISLRQGVQKQYGNTGHDLLYAVCAGLQNRNATLVSLPDPHPGSEPTPQPLPCGKPIPAGNRLEFACVACHDGNIPS